MYFKKKNNLIICIKNLIRNYYYIENDHIIKIQYIIMCTSQNIYKRVPMFKIYNMLLNTMQWNWSIVDITFYSDTPIFIDLSKK